MKEQQIEVSWSNCFNCRDDDDLRTRENICLLNNTDNTTILDENLNNSFGQTSAITGRR